MVARLASEKNIDHVASHSNEKLLLDYPIHRRAFGNVFDSLLDLNEENQVAGEPQLPRWSHLPSAELSPSELSQFADTTPTTLATPLLHENTGYFSQMLRFSHEAYPWSSKFQRDYYENRLIQHNLHNEGTCNLPSDHTLLDQQLDSTLQLINQGRYGAPMKVFPSDQGNNKDTNIHHHYLQNTHEVISSIAKDGKCTSVKSKPGKMTSLGASPKCDVCSYKPNEARVVTFCGHLFCWPCLCCWLHNDTPNKNCPVCKCPLTRNNLTALHGRQNTMTVARLQGMLRTDKQSVRGSTHARENRSKSLRQTRNRASSAKTFRGPRVELESGNGSQTLPIIAVENNDNVGIRDVRRESADDEEADIQLVSAVEVWKSSIGALEIVGKSTDAGVPPIITKDDACESVEHDHDHLRERVVSLITPEVIEIDSAVGEDVEELEMPDSLIEMPKEEIMDTANKLSVEWEETTSIIEDFYWASMHALINNCENVTTKLDENDPEKHLSSHENNYNVEADNIVESVLQERENAIQQLVVRPLQAAHEWLPGKLSTMQRLIHSLFRCYENSQRDCTIEMLTSTTSQLIKQFSASVESSKTSIDTSEKTSSDCMFNSEKKRFQGTIVDRPNISESICFNEDSEKKNSEDTAKPKRQRWS